MRDFLLAHGVAAERVRVIENWAVESPAAVVPTHASALRRSLHPAPDFVVAYSGNFGRAHEFETLIEAAVLLQADAGLAFLMIGGGARLPSVREAVVRRGLRKFTFLPYQAREQLGDSLAAADVQVVSLVPALEGLIVPSKLYGILAAGRPTLFIGDPDGEVARRVVAQRCGVAVRIGDPVGLAAAIRTMRADARWCADAGARARALFESRYEVGRAVEQWSELLQRCQEPGDAAVSRISVARSVGHDG
jgi:glycosyltransferase involved in cell wall biosynthesis